MSGCQRNGCEPEYEEYVARLRIQSPELAAGVGGFKGISWVLEWMERRGLNHGVDIVGQDEFHYDFLIRLDAEDHWIVFGVT
jgi:hypothetical protein